MIRRIVLPLLAVVGLLLAIYTVRASNPTKPSTQPVALPAVSPYAQYVAGAGLIEASTENIAVGAVVPGVVTEVLVKVSDHVKAGDPLFKIDDRELRAQSAVERASVASAQAELSNRERELARLQRAGESVSKDESERAYWQAEIARAQVEAAKARQQAVDVELDRRVIRAPVDGTLMQIRVRKGEYASAGPLATPLMLIGNIDTLHLRVDIDENDAWRIQPNANATANVRGNRELNTQLKFVRIEPYIVPKRSLTGDSSERVDTRVLQVIYAFDANEFQKKNGVTVYAGQQMDVFIEAKEQDRSR